MNEHAPVIADYAPINAGQYQQRVNLIQEVMRQVMKEETHYGTLPGCPKPSLYKPGAEVLRVTFNLGQSIPNWQVKDLPGGHREAIVTIAIKDQRERIVSEGIGSCTTLESKYRYRKGEGENTGKFVPKEYWDAKRANNLNKMHEILGGKGYATRKVDGLWYIFKAGDEKVEHTDPADYYNTILKMAKKRAFVDAILTATGASDIFTQDIEDMDLDDEAKPAQQPKAAAPREPEPEQPMPDYESESQETPEADETVAYKIPYDERERWKPQLRDHGHRWDSTRKVWCGGTPVSGEIEAYRVQI